MLKATTPVAVFIATWALGAGELNLKTLFNISFIVVGVVMASFGEIDFVLKGFLFQCGGIAFEAIRLVMVQRLLSSAEYKMDPLVSLYYFAPVCAVMNFAVALFWEIPDVKMTEVYAVGVWTLLANAMVAFALNVSVVFLIGRTSSLVLTLCGVLKDILLVVASVIIWGTVVTPLQFIGYGIALSGLVYYKLGAEALKGYFAEGGRKWAEFGAHRPILRKLVVLVVVVLSIFILLGGLAPTYAPEYDPKNYLNAATKFSGGSS
jgi:drug/metabolite transporter (DMT)-like permease